MLDGATTHDVHAVIDHPAHHFGGMVLGHGGHHRGRTGFQPFGDHLAEGFHGVGATGNVRRRFLHPFKLAHFGIELATDAGVGPHRAIEHFPAGGGQRRQRDAAPGTETLNQHPPTLAGHGRTTNDPVHGNEHVLTLDRAVHKGRAGMVAFADFHTRMVGG